MISLLGRKKSMNIIILLTLALSVAMTAALTGCGGQHDGKAASVDVASTGLKEQTSEYIYGIAMDENAGVTASVVADIYERPDVRSSRVTQALYNQPVSVAVSNNGWANVKTVDGSAGWMKSKYIDNDISSVYGRTYTHRIIVTSKDKTVTSNPSGGITRVEAPMGAEFYAFNSIEDAYEVFLPGNMTGWLKGSGIIHIKLGTMIPVTNADDFAATALKLKGTCYLLNGMSAAGIDASGLIYICARINGVNLPRTIEGQLTTGIEIKPDEARMGDLVFLAGTGEGESENITCAGICIGGGNYLYVGRKTGYAAIGEINRENADGIVVAARRIFNVTDN